MTFGVFVETHRLPCSGINRVKGAVKRQLELEEIENLTTAKEERGNPNNAFWRHPEFVALIDPVKGLGTTRKEYFPERSIKQSATPLDKTLATRSEAKRRSSNSVNFFRLPLKRLYYKYMTSFKTRPIPGFIVSDRLSAFCLYDAVIPERLLIINHWYLTIRKCQFEENISGAARQICRTST